MKVNFLYVRHGETIFNVTNKSQGACDSPLTENGINQARQCSSRLKALHIDKCYCSTSERALDTANIVLENRNVSIIPLKGLKEMSFGYLEGSDLTVPNSEMGKCWNAKDFTKYNGENRGSFEKRIRDTYQRIVDESKDGETILIVSHRGYFNYMLEALFNMDLDELERENPNYLETLIPNASVAKFYYEDGKYILEEMPK